MRPRHRTRRHVPVLRPVDAGPLARTRELEAAGLLHIGLQGVLGTGYASALREIAGARPEPRRL